MRLPAVQLVRIVLCTILVGAAAVSQNVQGNASSAPSQAGNPVVTGVRIVQDHGSPAVEIATTRRVVPAIESRDAPPRVIIDIPNARSAMPRKRIDVLQGNILTIRSDEHAGERPGKAPFLRIVVSSLVPYGYTWDAQDNRLMVRLKPPEDPYVASRKMPVQRPQAVGLTPTAAAAVVPVTSGVGEVLMADRRFAAGSSITAGSETAMLQLSRGGDIHVCPGTTLSVTPSKSTKDLMIGLSTGSMETHYQLGASADTILTPDFRILLAGPGEFNYAISTDSKGNTCVRGLLGNASSAIVSELIGDRVYQVKPSEEAVFHDGRIDKVDNDVPAECGCPVPVPVQRAETASPHVVPDPGSPNITLAQRGSPAGSHGPEAGAHNPEANNNEAAPQTLSSGPETRPLPRSTASEPHIQIEAPLVFRGRGNSAPAPAITREAEALPVTESSRVVTLGVQALPPAEGQPEAASHRGVLQRVKRFFADLFR